MALSARKNLNLQDEPEVLYPEWIWRELFVAAVVEFKQMQNLELKIPPPAIGLTIGLLMWCAATYWWPQQLTLTFLQSGSFVLAIAPVIALAIAGIGFDLAGLYEFRRHKTTINPLKPGNTAAIVSNGVYRYSRNPMYVGMLLILCAWAVYLAHLIGFLLLPLFVLLINRFQIWPEERILLDRFGDEYTVYKNAVRRWL